MPEETRSSAIPSEIQAYPEVPASFKSGHAPPADLGRRRVDVGGFRVGGFGVEGAVSAIVCMCFWGILGSILFAPSLYSHTLLHDYWIPLDAGWRLRFGQMPHLDFHSPLGLSFAAISWVGVELGGTPAKSLVWMDLVSAALAFAPAFLVSFSALSKRAAALSSIALVLLCLSPVQMDDYYFKVDWMGQYNRIGWAGFSMAGLFFSSRRPFEFSPILAGIAMGVLLLFLFFLKATFGAAAAAGVLASAILSEGCRRKAAVMALAVFGGVAAVAAATPFGQAYAADLLRAAAAGGTANLLGTILSYNAFEVGLCLLAIVFGGRSRWGMDAALLAAWLIMAVAAATQCGQKSVPFLIFLFLAASANPPCPSTLRRRRAASSALAGACVLMALWVAKDAESVVFAARSSWSETRTMLGFSSGESERNFDSRFERAMGWPVHADAPYHMRCLNGWEYLALAQDGVGFASAHLESTAGIMALSFVNPVPILGGFEPPRGGLLWWHYGRTYTDSARPAPEEVFVGAPSLLFPLFGFEYVQTKRLVAAYKDWIFPRYHVAARSEVWVLLVRNPPDSAFPPLVDGDLASPGVENCD